MKQGFVLCRMKIHLYLFACLFFFTPIQSQEYAWPDFQNGLKRFFSDPAHKGFNGIVYIAQHGKERCQFVRGYADLERKTPLRLKDQFVVGSVSKQFTAVLVLQTVEKGLIKLDLPIRHYLPSLTQSWADTITLHHLLTHTDGIQSLDKPLLFPAGTQFRYNQLNFDLMAKVLEARSGRSFAALAQDLFKKCAMKRSLHPDLKDFRHLVKGYTMREGGSLEEVQDAYTHIYAAAGGFISTATDLVKWNEALNGGWLLQEANYTRMTQAQKGAIRQHPVFGETAYGYGITVGMHENLLQLGQTGYCDGYASMNFYFPQSGVSVVVLSNVIPDEDDLKKAFKTHTDVLEMLRAFLKTGK